VETGCLSTPPDADARQVLVYSTPYDANGGQASIWHAAEFDDQSLSIDEFAEFEMGRLSLGEIVFTPNGSIGFVAQEDGSIGQFRIGENGVEVLETGLSGDWYAASLWFDAIDGNLWIVDSNWPDNGGGIYRAPVDCETAEIGQAERLLQSKNALGLRHTADGNLAFATREIPGETGNLFILDRAGEILASASVFDDDDFILSALEATEGHILVGDNSSFSSLPNRVASIEYSEGSFGQRSDFEILDPVSIVAGSTSSVLISSGYGDALYLYQPGSGSLSQVSTQNPVELPGVASPISRGQFAGGVVVPENLAIRLLTFSGDDIVDHGKIHNGSGYEGIVGVVGMAP
jgi:hypothetical protein